MTKEDAQTMADSLRVDAEGWIAWGGGECPVDAGTAVDVKLDDGTVHNISDATSDLIAWNSWIASGHSVVGEGCDIIAYRVVQS